MDDLAAQLAARLEAELGRHSNHASKPPSGDSAATRKKQAERRAEQRRAAKAGKKPKPPGKQLSITWCAANPNVSSVITGASRVSQVQENLKAAQVIPLLTPDVLARIDEITTG